MIGDMNNKSSVNDKLAMMFNKTTALSQLGMSHYEMKSNNQTMSHNLVVEASDADLHLPSPKGKKE